MSSKPSQPEIIAVSFQKGGTGKTFTALNVAGGLNARGFDVLLIDADPQGSLTANLGMRDIYEEIDRLSLDEVLLDVDKWSRIDEIILTQHDEFDILPANNTFKGNKNPLDSADAAEKRLKKALERLNRDYHYIIVDCPPDLSAYSKNAVTAGEQVIVPMVPRSEVIYSIKDLWQSYQTLGMMHDIDIQYLAYTLTYVSNKVTNQMREVIDWCEENTTPLVKVDDRAAFDRAKWQQGSIYQHTESLRNDQLPVFDEVIRLVLNQTNPPEYGVDLERAKEITPEDIRAEAGVK